MGLKKNFGFDIHSGRQIDLDRVDKALADELSELVGAWSACINCGSCVATCPAAQNGMYNFRMLHYQIRMRVETDYDPSLPYIMQRRVETDNNLSLPYISLEHCLLCGKCQLVCPRGIPTRYLAIQIMQKTRQHAEGIPSV
ncbi:MAG: 4Fe-4S dicluster domain-containing protein [Bacteroidales bacterium]